MTSSRFQKEVQVSEASTMSNRGWSTSGSAVDMGSFQPDEFVPSPSAVHYEESSIFFGGEGPNSPDSPRRHALTVDPSSTAERIGSVFDAEKSLVQSPEAMTVETSTSAMASYDQTHTSLSPSRPITPTQNKSRIYWNQLRSATLPGMGIATTAPPFIPPISISHTSTVPPPRSQTPKPSRLARLGFRQVVDHARDVHLDESNRFDMEIYQACISARFGDIRQKTHRDGSQGGYLPFMSTTSLPLPVTLPPSHTSKSGSTPTSPRSLRLLHHTLIRYASSFGSVSHISSLPYEVEVFSVLLLPFTTDFDRRWDDERLLAVEAFDVVVKTWKGSSPQCEIDRILWCCKAALIPASSVRSRVLGTLSNTLFSSSPLQNASPLALQNILQGLLLLLHSFGKNPQDSLADTQVVRELIDHVTTGACGELDQQKVEVEYEALWGTQDNEETVRNHIIAEGVVRCMQNGSESLRRWALHESVETYWLPSSESLSPLCRRIMARRLSAFFRASLSLLHLDALQGPHQSLELDSGAIVRLLHRALPELLQLPMPKHPDDSRALAVELAIDLLSVEPSYQKQQVVELICKWCEDDNGWKKSLETGLNFFIERTEWPRLAKVLLNVIREIPENWLNVLIPILFSALYMRLATDPAPHPLPELTSLLRPLAQKYPQQFYKALFSLAGASKDPTLVGQLGIVVALARHLPEFWMSDPEMMSVVLMSDIGSAIGKGQSKEGGHIGWCKTRIGQSLIMAELVRCVRQLIKEKKDELSPPDASQIQAHRFFLGLEARLAILLDAKERSALVPFSQRILLSALLLEIRLFTRSLKPAAWLHKVVTWTAQSYIGARLDHGDFNFHSDTQSLVSDDAFDEVLSTVSKMKSIYVACWQAPPPNTHHRSTVLPSSTFDPIMSNHGNLESSSDAVKEREEFMASLPTNVASATLPLLVAVCSLLAQKDHRVIGPVLWSRFLDEEDPRIVAPVCFLLTHCFEKNSKDVMDLVENDRNSSDSTTRRTLVRRLLTLFAWRSQLLSQTYIYDRARRRPFRMAQQPIAFVPIDAGSGQYVHEQTEQERKNLPGGTLPQELRKRLAEFGWEHNDQPTDTRLERLRAPISLFPLSHLESFSSSGDRDDIPTARSAESIRQRFRRTSSASTHHGVKRKVVIVPALVSVFSSISALAVDSDPIVAIAAREAILLMLRDDPVMLCRPVMDTLSTDLMRVGSAVSVLNAFLHIHHRLPPSASHHIFSHLGGFLKHVSRDSDNAKALRAFAYTAPLLAKLIVQVSNLSIRDLRRAKFEIYVFPSGSLWFPSTAPPSTMFPQSMGPLINPFDEFPPQLVGILMVRTAQNMLLLNMLKHKPHEVHAIRKNINALILPGQDNAKTLDINSFLPGRSPKKIKSSAGYQRISLAFSRSHLLLLGQVYRTMSRNFNDRAELLRLFEGLNRILLTHGDDIGIVSHALIACMVAVTRFKRFVSSSRGFAMFMPCLLKIYTESEGHAGIRQAIQYASSRFYAIHQEAYVFQSLDLASNILAQVELPEEQGWLAKNIYQLFSALKSPLYPNTPDAAGIRGANSAEERESLIATAVSNDSPHTGAQGSPRGEHLNKILAAGQYENAVLNLDDFIRLLLTVIAHDPTVMRAQNFLSLLRHMTPDFYNGSNSSRGVLRDGIKALGSALFTKAPRQRVQENVPGQKSSTSVLYGSADHVSDSYDPTAPCDQVFVRREYLKLIVAYSRMGGELRREVVQRALEIVKGLLKEPGRVRPESEGRFLCELTDTSLSRMSVTPKQAVALLSDLAPIIKTFALSVDCSGILDTITHIFKPELTDDSSFVQLVVNQIAGPVLDACDEAASENILLSLPMRPAIVSFISRAAAIGNADIISHIERQSPSPGFLAGIVLPLCMTMKTSAEFSAEWRHHNRSFRSDIVFLRLLVYVMDACHTTHADGETGRSSPLPGINRKESHRRKRSSLSANRTPLATLSLAIQIIKVIVLRAADGLSRGLIGIWTRLARFLQHLLDDGDARFALSSGSSTAPSSPGLGALPQTPSSDQHRTNAPVRAPRTVDYLAWSLLEYLCCSPSPLTIQMRLWMQEKVHHLDSELQFREMTTPTVGNGASRRISSSVFARPRGSSTSPDALRASHGIYSSPSELNLSKSSSTEFASYTRFSSHGSLPPSWNGPRIIHLGPANDHLHMFNSMERSFSQDSNLKSLARSSHIESPTLIKSTYHRIQLVQICMGYDRLLAAEGREHEPNTIDLKAWTTTSALANMVAETKLLMGEFSESFYENTGGNFVDVNPGDGFGSTP